MKSHEVVIANYGLPPQLMVGGTVNDVNRYVQDELGADGLLYLPNYSIMTAQMLLSKQRAQEAHIKVVRQSYSGETNPITGVVRTLQDKDLSPKQKAGRVGAVIYTIGQMQYKDHSLKWVRRIAQNRKFKVDTQFEWTARSVQAAQTLSRIQTDQQQRLIQLTDENIQHIVGNKAAQTTTDKLEETLKLWGFTGLSFHSSTSPVDHLETVAPLIKQYELTGARPDLPSALRTMDETDALASGVETFHSAMIRRLRGSGAPLKRIVYAIPGITMRDAEKRKNIIRTLRQM